MLLACDLKTRNLPIYRCKSVIYRMLAILMFLDGVDGVSISKILSPMSFERSFASEYRF